MQIKILNESGYDEALLGLSLSYNTEKSMDAVAKRLAKLDGGHNKFLESICVWIDINAPRFFHSQLDTYRVGTSKQSESTMHTILKQPLTRDNFNNGVVDVVYLDELNLQIRAGNLELVKNMLPEGFLQRRIICTNYKVLRNIISQRQSHKLKEWQIFCNGILSGCKYPEFLERKIYE